MVRAAKPAAPDFSESRCLKYGGCSYRFHPVWRSRTAKQRVWVGPGRYRGRCRDAVTNRVADSYANSNRYAFCMRAGNPDANGKSDCNCHSYCNCECYANGYGNSYCDPDSYANGHSNSDAYTDSYAYKHSETNPGGGSLECAILALNVRRINNLFACRAYLGRFGYERVCAAGHLKRCVTTAMYRSDVWPVVRRSRD
jgi:hypothetical protein